LAQIKSGIIGALAGGVGPEVDGIASSTTFETAEGVLLQVDGEGAAGARRGPMQRARAALLLSAAAAGLKAEQLQNG
jgi:hypothetical protein